MTNNVPLPWWSRERHVIHSLQSPRLEVIQTQTFDMSARANAQATSLPGAVTRLAVQCIARRWRSKWALCYQLRGFPHCPLRHSFKDHTRPSVPLCATSTPSCMHKGERNGKRLETLSACSANVEAVLEIYTTRPFPNLASSPSSCYFTSADTGRLTSELTGATLRDLHLDSAATSRASYKATWTPR